MRIDERLDRLYAIGGGPGANRPFGSPAEDEALDLAAAWMREVGLVVESDPDGNVVGRSGRRDDVWTGSHLDTVPQGGRFDGALGVVAAIDAVERAGAGAVVVFRGEEVGCVGSRALVARGSLPAVFLEVHVEQGPVLAREGAPLGIVTGIVGYARGSVAFEGRPGHAGTTPMEARSDALVTAAEAILRIREAALAIPGAVATVGQVEVEPGGVNVIPGRVRVSVDARAADAARLAELIDTIGLAPDQVTAPVEMSGPIQAVLREEVTAHGLPVVHLPSGAGHDAGILAAAGVASGMLFVRSQAEGVSHSPDELSSGEDVALAVDVLAGALRRLTT